jgi:prophage antirepressor-like protein
MSVANFILDIYENILQINNKQVIILFDKSRNIWFALPHLLQALQYSTFREEIKNINNIIDAENISSYEKLIENNSIKINKTNKIHPHTKMISEGGLYLLLSKSRKPLAIELKKQLYTTVLPEIRKKGQYKLNSTDRNKIKDLSKKIKLYQYELKRTKKQSFPDKTKKGFIYILKVPTIADGHKKICHKIGYTANLEKRLATYKTGNPDVELAHYENLHCNKKQLETCVVNLNILKRLKNRVEVICNESLENIKAEIEDCKKLLGKYVNDKKLISK